MKKAFKFLIPVLALVMIAAVFSIIASADGGEDEFAGLPVVFIATEAKGTGDGSSAENALGNGEGYAELLKSTDVTGATPVANTAYLKNALRLAYDQLIGTGGTIVVCGPLTIDSTDGVCDYNSNTGKVALRNSPSEFRTLSKSNTNKFRITSVYDGVDYRTTNGAKMTLDQTYTKSVGLFFNADQVIENVDIAYKYNNGNGWYSGSKATVLISMNGHKLVVGEGVNTSSEPEEGATAGRLLTIVGGDRYANCASSDITVKSGDWEAIIVGGHGMNQTHPGNITGDAVLNLEGGTVKNIYGEGGADGGGRGKNASIAGTLTVNIGEKAKVGAANGSMSDVADRKTINYDVNALSDANIKNFETKNPTGELNNTDPDPEPQPEPVAKEITIYVSDAGKGDGTTAESPIGFGEGYEELRDSFDAADLVSQYGGRAYTKSALYMAMLKGKELVEAGAEKVNFVLVGDTTLACNDAFSNAGRTSSSDIDLPKVNAPITLSAQNGAKLVLDRTLRSSAMSVTFSDDVTIENIELLMKYKTDNGSWYGEGGDALLPTTYLICFNGNAAVIGENVKTSSLNTDTGATGERHPSLVGGNRWKNIKSDKASVTVNSGDWEYVIGAGHSINSKPKYGELDGDVTVTINGGTVNKILGDCGELPGGTNGNITGTLTVNVNGGLVNFAIGNVSTIEESSEEKYTINYNSDCINVANISKFKNINKTGGNDTKPEYKPPEPDPFEDLPVIYIAAVAKGTGDGSSPENAMGNADDYASLVSQKDGKAYLKNALRLGFDALKDTGGTVVVCGPLTVDSADAFRDSPAEFHVQASNVNKLFKLTSVYGDQDYRTSGAKLILDQTTCQSLNLIFRSKVTIENITIDYKYSKGTSWYKDENATMFIIFNGMESVVGEGVVVNAVPASGATAGRYPSLIAGHRYSEVASTNLTVKSGTWYMVIAGSHGMGEKYPGIVKGDAKLTVTGGTIAYLLGEGGMHKTYSPSSEIQGNLEVIIEKGAIVKNANGSFSNNKADRKTITYDVTTINKANITNFSTATQTGEGNPPPVTGSYLTLAVICAAVALGVTVALISKKRKIED